MTTTFGDHVRIRETTVTTKHNLANREGTVFGVTTPSVTGVEVIGSVTDDVALNVHFEDLNQGFWFAPELVEFIDHAAGTEIVVGNAKFVREPDGSWRDASPVKSRWWQFWK